MSKKPWHRLKVKEGNLVRRATLGEFLYFHVITRFRQSV